MPASAAAKQTALPPGAHGPAPRSSPTESTPQCRARHAPTPASSPPPAARSLAATALLSSSPLLHQLPRQLRSPWRNPTPHGFDQRGNQRRLRHADGLAASALRYRLRPQDPGHARDRDHHLLGYLAIFQPSSRSVRTLSWSIRIGAPPWSPAMYPCAHAWPWSSFRDAACRRPCPWRSRAPAICRRPSSSYRVDEICRTSAVRGELLMERQQIHERAILRLLRCVNSSVVCRPCP